jgi:hypothetical protein
VFHGLGSRVENEPVREEEEGKSIEGRHIARG